MEEQEHPVHEAASEPQAPPPDRRKAAWIGMGALLVALILLGLLSGPSGNPDAGLPPPAADGKLATAEGADPEDASDSSVVMPQAVPLLVGRPINAHALL